MRLGALFGVVAYATYDLSDGEEQLFADVCAAWDAIAPNYRDKPVVIYGRSTGTALAAGRRARSSHACWCW